MAKMDEMEIWDLWLELKVDYILIEFSCGSDETLLEGTMIHDQSGSQIYSNDLSNFFEEEVFKKVDFVDATDNYYLGESGTVKITMVESGYSLDYNEEGEEFKDYWYEFIYNKKGDLDEMGKKNLILERRNKEINKFFEDFEQNYVKYAQEEKNKNSKKEQKPIRVYI